MPIWGRGNESPFFLALAALTAATPFLIAIGLYHGQG